MNILIVGGTGFLGGAMTDASAAAGHRVTVLTRGETRRPLPDGVEALVADRYGSLTALSGKHFDLVIDTCAYTPDAVTALLSAPAHVGRYALVSSISAYAGFPTPGTTEDAPVSETTPEQLAAVLALPPAERSSAAALGAAYGPLKAACEAEARRLLGDRALILRVGLLVGAGDYTDRFTYWVRRVDQGGEIPCPGDPARPVQIIDVRDIALWTLHAASLGLGGVFNLTSATMTMAALLETCRRVAGSNARFVWKPDEAVVAAGLAAWTDVPLWLPPGNANVRHLLEIGIGKALAQGLRTRPLDDTVAQVLAWDRGRCDVPLKAGMPPEKEAALLASAA